MLEQGTDRIEAFLLRLPRGSRRHVLRGWRERYLDFGQVERFWEREREEKGREKMVGCFREECGGYEIDGFLLSFF